MFISKKKNLKTIEEIVSTGFFGKPFPSPTSYVVCVWPLSIKVKKIVFHLKKQLKNSKVVGTL